MKVIGKTVVLLLICDVIGRCVIGTSSDEVFLYRGTSDASAAVAVGDEMFVVADDENNVLRVYKVSQTSLPVFSCDLTQFLDIEMEHPEADIEGATMIGESIYWITSHGRNRDGKMRPNRYRFFATKVKVQDQNITISPVGTPCRTLIHSLIKTESMRRLQLERATRFDATNLTEKERGNLAPKKNGLNIETLCASANGKIIYIGFRNPRPRSKALVVPLNNPKQVIEKQPPIFAAPLLWDLTGYGIRSMEYSYFHKAYFIIAGAHDEKPGFALYRWSGDEDDQPVRVQGQTQMPFCAFGKSTQKDLDKYNFTPEALITFKACDKFLLLSDDGSLPVDVSDPSECMHGKLHKNGTCLNKYLTDPNEKHFRAVWFRP
ncbi:MAG: DUF3616 domain-containing protein [Planctomycetota bacterium]|nr:MAG: DUF3616 domain-containing protein [Planctomycetota bacterium]